MAKNIEMQYYDGSTYDICYPYTLWGNVYETYGGTTLATAITNINSQITGLSEQVSAFSSSISSVNSSIIALDERVSIFEQEISKKNATETIAVTFRGSYNCSQNYYDPEPSLSMNSASQNYSYCTLNFTYPTGQYTSRYDYYFSGPSAITMQIGTNSSAYTFKMYYGEYEGDYGGAMDLAFTFSGKIVSLISYSISGDANYGSAYLSWITASAYMFNM